MNNRLPPILAAALLTAALLAGCTSSPAESTSQTGESSPAEIVSQSGDGYQSVTPQQAKELMDSTQDYIILDVRTQPEYDEGHLPDAVLIPDTEIASRAERELPKKDQLIFVYCRSGRRSKNASRELAAMGYTNIKEFGGIIDWPYEIVQ